MILEKIKNNKKKLILLFGILTIIFLYNTVSWVPRFEATTEHLWNINIHNDRELVGSTENVFIGKVIKKKGQEIDRFKIPKTKFEVKILKNIKGHLKNNIIIRQRGGYRGIKKYKPDEGGFLKPQKTYLFFASGDDHYIFADKVSHQEFIKNSEKYSEKEILNLKETKKIISKYEDAYKNEIYSYIDLLDNRLKNSYKKLTDEERQKMIDEYIKKKKEESKKDFIKEQKEKGIKVTDEDIQKEIEKEYAGIDTKIKK